jgi:D-xylose transport system ATP-binding protein
MPESGHQPVLSLRGVSKNFGAVSALTDVDLDVHAGEVVALVGDNGAGKSTLVKILAGVHQPSAGTITFGGKEVVLADPATALGLGIATVFQDLALCENLDVVANIFLGRELNPSRLDEVSMEIRAWTLLNELSARIVVLRLGRNNGEFGPDASNQELVTAITGADENSVSRRANRRRAQQAPEARP